jgi:hypothetical protein
LTELQAWLKTIASDELSAVVARPSP